MSKLRKFTTTLFTAAVVGLAASPFVAQAAQINATFVPGTNQIEDTDVERVLRDGVDVTSGDLQEGDVIQSILQFTTVNTALITTYGATFNFNYQLTALSELQIASITQANLDGTDAGGPCLITTNCFFTFTAANLNLDPNVLVAVYENPTGHPAGENFSTNTTATEGIARATSGTLVLELGLGEAGDFWTAAGPLSIDAIEASTPGGGQNANGSFGLSVVGTNDLPIADDGILSPVSGLFHDVIGDSSVFGAGTGVRSCSDTITEDCWIVASNTEANFTLQVPEPGTLALLGLALFGLAGIRRMSARA